MGDNLLGLGMVFIGDDGHAYPFLFQDGQDCFDAWIGPAFFATVGIIVFGHGCQQGFEEVLAVFGEGLADKVLSAAADHFPALLGGLGGLAEASESVIDRIGQVLEGIDECAVEVEENRFVFHIESSRVSFFLRDTGFEGFVKSSLFGVFRSVWFCFQAGRR